MKVRSVLLTTLLAGTWGAGAAPLASAQDRHPAPGMERSLVHGLEHSLGQGAGRGAEQEPYRLPPDTQYVPVVPAPQETRETRAAPERPEPVETPAPQQTPAPQAPSPLPEPAPPVRGQERVPLWEDTRTEDTAREDALEIEVLPEPRRAPLWRDRPTELARGDREDTAQAEDPYAMPVPPEHRDRERYDPWVPRGPSPYWGPSRRETAGATAQPEATLGGDRAQE